MTSEMHSFKIQDGDRRHLRIFAKIQDAGLRHHFEFRKTVAMSLLVDQSSLKLVGLLLL